METLISAVQIDDKVLRSRSRKDFFTLGPKGVDAEEMRRQPWGWAQGGEAATVGALVGGERRTEASVGSP